MKLKLAIVAFVFATAQQCFSQNTIIGNGTVFNSDPTNNLARSAWFRGGNFIGGPAGANNVFGTLWNSSIYTYTNNTFKTKLNGDYSYGVNGFLAPRNGFLFIGQEQPPGGGIPINYFQDRGAFTRLHLHDNV